MTDPSGPIPRVFRLGIRQSVLQSKQITHWPVANRCKVPVLTKIASITGNNSRRLRTSQCILACLFYVPTLAITC